MKRTLMTLVLVLTAAGTAGAADLPLPSPQPPPNYFPVAPFDWGGFYGGINGGYGFGNTNWVTPLGAIGSFTTSGALIGGTLGYNIGAGPVVFGIEGDGDWTNAQGNSSAFYCTAITAGAMCETKATWLSTVRLRIGYAFDRVLVYGTGGVAVGDIQAGFNSPPAFDVTINVGWAAGGGVEFAFDKNWTAKVEYLYVDLGNLSCGANCGLLAPVTVPLTENIVRVGVNYRFASW